MKIVMAKRLSWLSQLKEKYWHLEVVLITEGSFEYKNNNNMFNPTHLIGMALECQSYVRDRNICLKSPSMEI